MHLDLKAGSLCLKSDTRSREPCSFTKVVMWLHMLHMQPHHQINHTDVF